MVDNPEKDPNNTAEEEETKRLEQALKQDRLGGWPAIIGIGGTLACFINMIFRGWDAYINIGSASLYLWELCLLFLAITVAFLPASIKDARYLAAGKQRPSIGSFSKGILTRLLIAATVIVLIYQFI